MVETINKLARVTRQLHQELGREATVDELAAELGVEPERVAEIQRIAQEPVSLQSPIGEEESDLGDFIEDADAVVPIEAAAFIMLQEQLDRVLCELSEREQRIIQLRFGLSDGHPRTLEEVGREFGVTPRADQADRVEDTAQAPSPVARRAAARISRLRTQID